MPATVATALLYVMVLALRLLRGLLPILTCSPVLLLLLLPLCSLYVLLLIIMLLLRSRRTCRGHACCRHGRCCCPSCCRSRAAAVAAGRLVAAHRDHRLRVCHCGEHAAVCGSVCLPPLRLVGVVGAHAGHCPVQHSCPNGDGLAHRILHSAAGRARRQTHADRE